MGTLMKWAAVCTPHVTRRTSQQVRTHALETSAAADRLQAVTQINNMLYVALTVGCHYVGS